MRINTETGKAFVFSSGKDMGVFKGVGFPEDIAAYFCLEDYQGYLWSCHGRFPTNTPGWWGGAHPFNILDWTVVHNGELSSYGINRRYLEMYGYKCTLQTDTEVLAYAVDLLMRKQRLPIEVVSQILASPFWSEIDQMDSKKKLAFKVLRQTYGSLADEWSFQHNHRASWGNDWVNGPHQAASYDCSDQRRACFTCPVRRRRFVWFRQCWIRLWAARGGEPLIGRVGSKKFSSKPMEAQQ